MVWTSDLRVAAQGRTHEQEFRVKTGRGGVLNLQPQALNPKQQSCMKIGRGGVLTLPEHTLANSIPPSAVKASAPPDCLDTKVSSVIAMDIPLCGVTSSLSP